MAPSYKLLVCALGITVAAGLNAAGAVEYSQPSHQINITGAFQPMVLSVSTAQDLILVGLRNCPDDTNNEVRLLSLSGAKNHSDLPVIAGISQAALAKSASGPLIAGVGWDKGNGTTTFYGPRSYRKSLPGAPSYGIPAVISIDGRGAAFLWEMTPDARHLNNRSATLTLLGADGKSQDVDVVGQMARDPQSVAISAHGNGATYTVGAVFGGHNAVFDWDTHTGEVQQVWSSGPVGLEVDIAVDGHGRSFAVTSGGGTQVDVYVRAGKTFSKVHTLKPPESSASGAPLQPFTMAFDRADATAPSSLLVVAWGDQSGMTLAVTAHLVRYANATVEPEWVYNRTCSASDLGFDYVMQPGLAVSATGKLVAVGSWGCDPTVGGTVLGLQGRGGDGKSTLVDAKVPGQVWAIDVDVDSSGASEQAHISAGSWSTSDGVFPAQVTTWSFTT